MSVLPLKNTGNCRLVSISTHRYAMSAFDFYKYIAIFPARISCQNKYL